MSTAGPSKAGSTSSTPAPASMAETYSHASNPKPFKSSAFNKPMNRRNKALKQIITAERDVALGITNRSKKKRAPGEEPLVIVRGKHRLAGAAAKAALRREAKAKKEAEEAEAEAAAEEEGEPSEHDGETPGPSNAADAGESPGPSGPDALADVDTTMDDGSSVGNESTLDPPKPTEAPRRDLPTCESLCRRERGRGRDSP